MRRQAIIVLTAALAASAGAPAAPPVPKGVRAGDAKSPAPKVVPIGLVRVAPAGRRISLDAEVCLRSGVLEFMIVAWQTKTHESILHTKTKASHLHAALLMLGLAPGKPARWSGQDEQARFLPPAGGKLRIQFAWKGKNGKAHLVDAGSWLKGSEQKRVLEPKEWVFVGSEVLPDGRYWAEADGEVISVTNFASAVIDVPFRSSNANEQREYYANTDAIPPTGTKVEVIIAPLAGAEKALDARRMVEIDRFGTVRIDGQAMSPDELQAWATKYIERHERGMVVIRAAGGALVRDVADTRLNLRLGGVREFNVQRITPEGELLPRTAEQAKRALKQWDDKFANAHELIHEPGGQARRLLDRIDLRLREMDARKALLDEYAAHLRRSLRRYKASTQPAAGGKPAGARE